MYRHETEPGLNGYKNSKKKMKILGCVGKCLWEIGKMRWGGYDHDTLYIYIYIFVNNKRKILFKIL